MALLLQSKCAPVVCMSPLEMIDERSRFRDRQDTAEQIFFYSIYLLHPIKNGPHLRDSEQGEFKMSFQNDHLW